MVAAAVVGSAVVGGVASSMAADKTSSAEKSVAASQQQSADAALEAQTQQAHDLLAFNEQQYSDAKERQVGIDALNEKVINQNLDLSQKAGERADDQYNFYVENGRPVVQQALTDAKNWDSQGNIDAARGRAGADVQQAFDNTQQQSQRALSRMGVNPNSGRFLAVQQRNSADAALGMAGAETNAEQNVRTQAVSMRQQASNLAQGLPAQSMSEASQSSATGVAATGVAATGASENNTITQQALNGLSAGANIYGSAASGYSNIYGTASRNYQYDTSLGSQTQAGWGSLAGMGVQSMLGYADGGTIGGTKNADGRGGKIRGPGTGTSDSVQAVNRSSGQPVHLSNGEYVVSADTVRALGTKYFDKLQEKYHTPVHSNLGRAA